MRLVSLSCPFLLCTHIETASVPLRGYRFREYQFVSANFKLDSQRVSQRHSWLQALPKSETAEEDVSWPLSREHWPTHTALILTLTYDLGRSALSFVASNRSQENLSRHMKVTTTSSTS